MYFVDSNIFLRFLTNDDPIKAKKCFSFFQRVECCEIEIATTESCIAEVVYILQSPKLYALSPKQIREALLPILLLKNLIVVGKKQLIQALDIMAEYSIDFEDCLLASYAKDQPEGIIMSYDQDFDKISGTIRNEP